MGGILSVSKEFSTNNDRSIKSSYDPTGDKCSVDCVYLISSTDIGKEIMMEFDTYSTSKCSIQTYYRSDNSEGIGTITSTITSPANIKNHITVTLNEIVTNTYSVAFRVTSVTNEPIYIDNVHINIP